MKSIIAFIVLVIAVLIGGLYYKTRTVEQRTSDWQKAKSLLARVMARLSSIRTDFTNVFVVKPEPAPPERVV